MKYNMWLPRKVNFDPSPKHGKHFFFVISSNHYDYYSKVSLYKDNSAPNILKDGSEIFSDARKNI